MLTANRYFSSMPHLAQKGTLELFEFWQRLKRNTV